MARDAVTIKKDSIAGLMLAAYEHAYDAGWTDGLPVIPPTAEAVAAFVAAAGRPGDEVVATLPPRKGEATVEVIAVNAVMAGCRPEYMPVIVAAIDAISDRRYPLEFIQVTTNPMTPFFLVNGPVRDKLEINYGTGCLGPGWRANATIGRAVRLILQNVGGALPGVYSKSSFGSPLRYAYICGENEEENPWTPFHVDMGFSKDDSVITAFKASNYCNISGGEGVGATEILRQIASNMPPMYGGGDGVLLLMGVNHAANLHDAGLTKREIQEQLWQMARVPESHFAADFVVMEKAAGRGGDGMLYRTAKPEDIHIVVAGGPGPQDVYIAGGRPQTRLIRT